MASYKILFKPSVEKDFSNLPRAVARRANSRIEELAQNPFPANSVKISGSERLYRVRVGDYRIVYEVNSEARVIIVHYVRHRREVYRGL